MTDRDQMAITSKTLELLRRHESIRVRHDTWVETDFDFDLNDYVVRVVSEMLSDKVADDYYEGVSQHEWPATTWQMFKARHAYSFWLAWFVKRRPVRTMTQFKTVPVKVERYLLYPDKQLPESTMGRAVIYEMTRQILD